MDYKDILTLLNAGYTKAEIDQMTASSPATPTAGEDNAQQASLLSPAGGADVPSSLIPQQSAQRSSSLSSDQSQPIQPAEEKVPAPQPAGEGSAAQIEQLQQMISSLISQVQQGNRDSAEMGAKIIDPHQSAIETLRSLSNIPINNPD